MRTKHYLAVVLALCVVLSVRIYFSSSAGLRHVETDQRTETESSSQHEVVAYPLRAVDSSHCPAVIEKNIHFADRDLWRSLSDTEIYQKNREWKTYLREVVPTVKYESFGYKGRGIVYTASNLSIRRCIVSLKFLRKFGCVLPVEIWYMGDELIGMEHELKQLQGLNAITRDLLEEQDRHSTRIPDQLKLESAWFYGLSRNYQMKSLALLLSPFQEVLYLDSDNLPLVNPEYLFDSPEYQKYGAIFWHDFWKYPPDNPMWRILELDCEDEWEQESGQLVIDKKRSWEALLMTLHFQREHSFYFRVMLGDKDTYRFSWKITKTLYHSVYPVGLAGRMHDGRFCGHTMMQLGLDGEYLFAHTTVMKGTSNLHEGNTWDLLAYYQEQQILESVETIGYPVVVEYGGLERLPNGLEGRVPCLDFHVEPLHLDASANLQGRDSRSVTPSSRHYSVVMEAFSAHRNGKLKDLEVAYYDFYEEKENIE